MKRYFFICPLCLILLVFTATHPAQADYKQAVTYYSQGDYNRAIQELKPDLDKSPNWEFGHRLLGLCYLGINNNALAVSSLSRAAELNSTAFSTYYGLGQAYFSMQRYNDAISSMNRAEPLAARESNPEAEKAKIHLIRGSAYYRANQYANAVGDLQNAIRTNASNWSLHSMLGISYFNLNRTDEAIQTLEKAISLKPGEEMTKDVLGKAYLKKGVQSLSDKQYAAAVQSLTKARSHNPDDGYINYNLAEAYLFQKQYPAAEKALVAASNQLPNNAGVLTRLGLVYERQNKRDLALKAYQKAYELNPSEELKEAVARFSGKN